MKIKQIIFGFFSPKQIKDMAAVKIEIAELYDPDGFPIETGLADLRLGVVDPGLRCRTCGGTIGQCLGHFGYLELTKPVVHPLFGKKIYMIIRSTCRKCGKLLMEDGEVKGMKNPLNEIYKKGRKTCPHCGEKQKDIVFQKPTSYREGRNELTSEEVRQRLEKIPDEDVQKLRIRGGRPEWLILTILPVPPVTVRPSITLETGERSEDDLTHKLVDVVRINERLRKNLELGAPDFIIADIWELLQYHVSTYINNEISTLPPARHRSGRALRTLVQRLGKKDGRFRGNLSGKRVNFSARTVISPDPFISINEVGVPEEIVKELTMPVTVNKSNLSSLKKIIMNGPTKHPGANYVLRPDGIRKKITDENKSDIANEIDSGYIVEKHLADGDTVIFNRQPSLHRMSMMAHKVRVMPFKTFRVNLCTTIPYNADFDGDEMNLHVPQTEEAQLEADELMLVEKHIRSPRYGLPVIACKQDHITGNYLLTKGDSKFGRREAIEIMLKAGIEIPEKLKDEYTGKEIFSFIIPENISVEFKSSFCSGYGCKSCDRDGCPYDAYVVIKDGKLKKGVIDENALGEKKGKLLNVISHLDPDVVRKFIDDVSKLGLVVVSRNGFSVSISDVDISDRVHKRITDVVEECEDEVRKHVKNYLSGKTKKLPGLSQRDVLENNIRLVTGESSKRASDIIKTSIGMNSAVVMARTGARGSFVNLTQMCAFVGQESLEGGRIHRGYNGRTLSCFNKGDLGLKARGFVTSGYKDGLDPIDFFFDAINSRENLMDKSLHTRHSGYMERRLVNALQDLKVEYDGTVRDSRGHVIQFLAGEDGIDPVKSDNGKINPAIVDSVKV